MRGTVWFWYTLGPLSVSVSLYPTRAPVTLKVVSISKSVHEPRIFTPLSTHRSQEGRPAPLFVNLACCHLPQAPTAQGNALRPVQDLGDSALIQKPDSTRVRRIVVEALC